MPSNHGLKSMVMTHIWSICFDLTLVNNKTHDSLPLSFISDAIFVMLLSAKANKTPLAKIVLCDRLDRKWD